MSTVRHGGWWGIFLGLGLALSGAASLAAVPETLRFEQFGVEQGLAQANATAILQDRQGFIWFGTQAGLTRYDGYRVTVFLNQPDDTHSLADNFVTALHEDSEGRLWVGTRGGVLRYDATRMAFQRFVAQEPASRGTGNRQIRAIVGDFPNAVGGGGTKYLWIATADGLQRLDTKRGTFEVWHHEASRAKSLISDDVQSLVWDRQGQLWVGTSAGLDRFDARRRTFEHFRIDTAAEPEPKRNSVTALRIDSRDTLWVGTSTGLEAWSLSERLPKRQRLGAEVGMTTGPVRSILHDRDGVPWVGTRSGLLRWDADRGRFVRYRHDPRDPFSLADDQVDSLFQDRSGTLWVGTSSNGTSRVDLGSGGFERIAGLGGDQGSRDANKVYAIAGDVEGHVWLGTVGGGLQRIDRRTGEIASFRHDPADPHSLPDDIVRAVGADAQGQLWVGTLVGIARFDPKTERFRVRHFADLDPSLDVIRSIRISRSGALWIGTERGLHRYEPGSDSVRTFLHDSRDTGSLSQGRVLALLEDRQGTLWAGTDTGLDRWDANTGRFTHFRHDPANPESLSHDRVTHLFEDRAGQLWVGTGGGLNRMENRPDGGFRFRSYTHADGLGADPIGAILQDGAGRLWISTTSGLSRFDPVGEKFRNYSAGDGLLVGGYYVSASHATADGMFYFGGPAGLSAFRPETIRENSVPPPVIITELQVFNRPVLGDQRPNGVRFEGTIHSAKALRLSHANSVFSLEFAALHYADPARNRYAYQLIGFDPDWIQTDASRRFVTYTNLDPGHYVFRVKAANKDGVWNETGTTLDITIDPPFWATWWFRMLAVIALLASVWALVRYRVREITRQRALLAQEVSARTAEVVQQKEDIEQAHNTLSVLGEIGREITATLDETAIFQTIDSYVHALLDAATIGIYLIDADGRGLTSVMFIEGGKHLPQDRIELSSPTRHAARCARERRELLLEWAPDEEDPSYVPGTLNSLSALFAPLAIGDRLLGVMTIQSPRQHAYGERERLVFRSLCAYGAIALDNASAYRRLADADSEVQRMLREQQLLLEQEVGARTVEVLQQKADIEQAHSTLSVLGEIGREITAKLVEAEVCHTLDRHVHGLLDAATFVIYLLDADGVALTSVLQMEDGKELPVDRIELDSPTRHAAACARERRELQYDMDPDKENPSQVPGTLRILSSLFAPLEIGDRLLGVMTIQSPRRHVYGERERLVFRTLSAYGAIALDNAAAYRRLAEADAEVQRVLREQQAWLEQEVSARTAEVVRQKEDIEQAHGTLSVLGDVGREITATLDEAAIFQTLDHHVHALLDAAAFGIYLMDADERGLTSAHLVEEGQPQAVDRIDLSNTTRIGARCVREQRELVVNIAPEAESPSHVPGTMRTHSALFAPLMIGERVLGMMTIQSPLQNAYGEREQVVFRTLCSYGSIALDNAAAYRRLAETDATVQRMLLEQQLMFDNVAAAVFFIKGRIIHRCNRGMEEMLGYAPGEMIGKSTEIYHPSAESWEALGRQVYPLIAAGQVAEGEWEIMRKNGEQIWISFRGRALDPQDESQGSIWVAHDITERKRTAAALERALREQQILFDNVLGGIMFTKGRVVVRCNRGLEQILGYEPGELDGRSTRMFYKSDEDYESLFERAVPVLTAGGVAQGEIEYVRKDGSILWLVYAGKAVDPNDLSQGVIWSGQDFGAQKQAEAALKRALQEKEIIFDNMTGGMWIANDGVIQRCNRGFEEMLGLQPGTGVGMSLRSGYVSEEAYKNFVKQSAPDISAGKVVSGESEYLRSDGDHRWMIYQGKALDANDLSQGTIWFGHDITERKRSETALLEANVRLERGLADVEQLNRQVSLLGELTGFLQACPSATEAFACIGDFGPRLFPDSAGALFLAEETGDTWVEHGHWGGTASEQPTPANSFLGSECWALRRSRTYRVDIPSGALCCPHVPDSDGPHRPYACLPLTAQGKTFGLLYIEHQQILSGVEADRRHGLAVAMAEQIALSIANVQLREALLQQSIRDPLTGLYNRRFLQETLFREIAHSKRNHSTFAVLMIDVDHFKKFNDTFGHHAGDLVLQNVARTIEAQFRRSDVACRFGGEEFTVLLPGTDLELAQRLANGVLEGIRELVLSHDNKPLDRITASLGVAIFPGHGGSPEALLEAADAALYQAKEAGRNRVVVCGSGASA